MLAAAFGLSAASAQAVTITITADGTFTVEYFGTQEDPNDFYDPPLEFDGFFSIRENRVADFEFTVFGRTWTEADVRHCDCLAFPVDFPPPQYDLGVIGFSFIDGADSWGFVWAVNPNRGEGLFRFGYNVDGFRMQGDSNCHNGCAGIAFSELAYRINVPESGTLALLLLGLAGFPITRRLQSQ
jgi:hypothetical protein